MKKLGKKLSYLTKVILVIGLIISNLSSLSIVFAYEAEELLQLILNDDKLNITYLDDLDDYENVNIKVYENYTYLDNTSYFVDDEAMTSGITGKETTKENLNTSEFLQEGYELETILKDIIFDGFYEVKVELLDELNQVIDTATYSNQIEHSAGLLIKAYDEYNNEIEFKNDTYLVSKDNPKVNIVAKILPGELSPMDKFHTEDTVEFTARELIEYEFSSQMDFTNLLYGEYILPVSIKLYDEDENQFNLEENIKLNYETFSLNEDLLNNKTIELGKDYKYKFNNNKLYALITASEENTVLDLYEIVESLYGTNEEISYIIGNNNYEDILATFDLNQTELTLEEYLESILLDNTTYLTLSSKGLTIKYTIQVVGDFNNDNILDTNDILDLINYLVINEKEFDEKYDLYQDNKVDTLDIMYLDQIIKNDNYDIKLKEEDATISANLNLENDDIISGDEFTVSYIVSIEDYEINGIAGSIKYNEEILELLSVSSPLEWIGVNNENNFLYIGNSSLTANNILTEDGKEELLAQDYIVLNITFRAKKSGTSELKIENLEYFNQDTYYNKTNEVEAISIEVNASDDNSLSSLTIAGQTIDLQENVFDYTITVKNDVTEPLVSALVSNITANITSITAPEELVEGENIVVITVTSESGNERIYTITINRESAPKENNTTQINYTTDNTDNNEDNETKEDLVITTPSTDEDDDENDDYTQEENNISRIIIIILILLVIAGLIYLIFKDEEDEDTKKVNKEVNKLKKETVDITEIKVEKKSPNKTSSKTTTNKNGAKKNTTNKNKKNNK